MKDSQLHRELWGSKCWKTPKEEKRKKVVIILREMRIVADDEEGDDSVGSLYSEMP